MTKNEVIDRAYEELRISGITSDPTPSDLAKALDRLEVMMAEFFSGWNMNLGYNFEENPSLSSETNVPFQFKSMMVTNLAIRLIPIFNQIVPDTLKGLASTSFSSALGVVKADTIREVQPSRRMPRGSGNTVRNIYLNRYMIPTPLPRTNSSNNVIFVGETFDYYEDFSAWLGSNTIASFTIEADPRLTIDASANADPRITYTITAGDADNQGVWQYVKIAVTDSAGRVDIRLINFEVLDVPEVG